MLHPIVERSLVDIVEGQAPSDVSAHLSECPSCRAEVEALRKAAARVDRLPQDDFIELLGEHRDESRRARGAGEQSGPGGPELPVSAHAPLGGRAGWLEIEGEEDAAEVSATAAKNRRRNRIAFVAGAMLACVAITTVLAVIIWTPGPPGGRRESRSRPDLLASVLHRLIPEPMRRARDTERVRGVASMLVAQLARDWEPRRAAGTATTNDEAMLPVTGTDQPETRPASEVYAVMEGALSAVTNAVRHGAVRVEPCAPDLIRLDRADELGVFAATSDEGAVSRLVITDRGGTIFRVLIPADGGVAIVPVVTPHDQEIVARCTAR